MALVDTYQQLAQAATPGVVAITAAELRHDDAVTGSTERAQDGTFYVEALRVHELVTALVRAAAALDAAMSPRLSYSGKRKALKNALAPWLT